MKKNCGSSWLFTNIIPRCRTVKSTLKLYRIFLPLFKPNYIPVWYSFHYRAFVLVFFVQRLTGLVELCFHLLPAHPLVARTSTCYPHIHLLPAHPLVTRTSTCYPHIFFHIFCCKPAPGGIRTRHPSKRAAADLRLRPRGHQNRQKQILLV
jgi:hypothetical protein